MGLYFFTLGGRGAVPLAENWGTFPDYLTHSHRSYVAGDDFRELWRFVAYRAALTIDGPGRVQ